MKTIKERIDSLTPGRGIDSVKVLYCFSGEVILLYRKHRKKGRHFLLILRLIDTQRVPGPPGREIFPLIVPYTVVESTLIYVYIIEGLPVRVTIILQLYIHSDLEGWTVPGLRFSVRFLAPPP